MESSMSSLPWTDLTQEDDITSGFIQIPNTTVYKWTRSLSNRFLIWWRDSSWYQQFKTTEFNPERRINWSSAVRSSTTWAAFDQGAKISTGEPVIICQNCKTILIHPGIKKTGTSSMKTHLASAACRRQAHNPSTLEQSQLTSTSFTLSSQPTSSTSITGRAPGSKCALAIDNWSSPGTRICFMAVIACYINSDWEYKEALIGFEPLDAAHTGKELAVILRQVISQYKLNGQVHSITTDNASNNPNMMKQMAELIEDIGVGSGNFFDNKIYHIPCFSHIIQLAEKALLGSIRICPTNKDIQLDWDEKAGGYELQTLKKAKGLPWTLGKVRKFAVFVNSSSQRQLRFATVQRQVIPLRERVLRLLQDVSTRWDLTVIMLIRYIKLRQTIEKFTAEFAPATIFWTTNIGTATDSRIGYVLGAYDELFEALEECNRRLKPLSYPWIPELLTGIDKAIQKLDKYYNKTYGDLGSFYALGAILSPRLKMSAFSPKHCWLKNPDDSQIKFENELRQLYSQYYSDREQSSYKPCYSDWDLDPMSLVFDQRNNQGYSKGINDQLGFDGEIDRYLALPSSNTKPLRWWKDNEALFPGLAAMARDIVCIPASGTIAERFLRQRLSSTMDTYELSDAELAEEYQSQVDSLMAKLEMKYFPDSAPQPPGIPNRTTRNETRRSQLQARKQRLELLHSNERTLSRNLVADAAFQQELNRRDIRNRESNIFDFPSDEERDFNRDGDYELPRLLPSPMSQHPKRRRIG
ncbi:hypothetical protein BP5796_08695 [Coleophoma crateriformis]|uniref:HAT C-terminal dimerisation domain-containing protein n=1 Tax=Coleophoma crateriformis TaxID=565419 RepID=A0A3D8R8R7_9HELO|nr:hypothetical protein BP5796_08695 [Coleophoma crateriformis]